MSWGDQGSLERRWGLALGVQSLAGYNSKGTSQVALVVKNPPVNAGDMASIPGLGKIPWRRAWQPTPVSLPGESHRQRSLEGHSPRGCKESDTTQHARPVNAKCLSQPASIPTA